MSTKKKKIAKLPYYTIGVRFLTSNPSKTYTYRVRSRHKVILGQALVVDTDHGMAVVAVVRIDTVQQDTDVTIRYKFIEKKVADL